MRKQCIKRFLVGIIAMAVLLTSNCLAFASASMTKDEMLENVGRYVQTFIYDTYEDKNLEVGKVTKYYEEDDVVGGYCVDIIRNSLPNGYVIVKLDDGAISVSEFAVGENIVNPFVQIIRENGVDECNAELYSVGAYNYQVVDNQKRQVYGFDKTSMTKSQFHSLKELSKKNYKKKKNKNNGDTYSGSKIDGWSVVTDTYSGSVKSKNTLPGASNMTFYNQDNTSAIGKTYACSVVALSNMMNYLRKRGYTKITTSFKTLYTTLWKYAGTDNSGSTKDGNIPVAARSYLDSIGYHCTDNPFWLVLFSDFKRDINAGKPCVFTYHTSFGGEIAGHAVFVVGYVETTQNQYLQIADGWHTYSRYITLDGYSYLKTSGWSFNITY